MGKKRAFILGAGFSKQAGMPLATELTSLILTGTRLKRLSEMQEWMSDFQERLAAISGASEVASRFQPNVEQLFDFAKYDEELWRMRQQLSPVGRDFGQTPWQMAEAIPTWLDYMEEELSHVIWDAQQRADIGPIRRFTDLLSTEDTVLTFNYDTLVEKSLCERGETWNHGLSDCGNGGITILKLHGSIDWILLQRKNVDQLEKFVKLFSKQDTNVEEHGHTAPQEEEYTWELWRAKDNATCNSVIEMDKSGLTNIRYHLGIAGLGQYKPLHRLPGSATTWVEAFKALRDAEEIYVIGFSMSPYDTMVRFHFTSVVRARANPLKRTVIIDPNASFLVDSYLTMFGDPLELITKKAESITWDEVLA